MLSRAAMLQAVLPNVAHVPLANDDQRRDCKASSLTDAQSTDLHPPFSKIVFGVNSASALTNADKKMPTVTCSALTGDSASITLDGTDEFTREMIAEFENEYERILPACESEGDVVPDLPAPFNILDYTFSANDEVLSLIHI